MTLLLIAVLLGVSAGLVTGGRLRKLEEASLRGGPALVLSLVALALIQVWHPRMDDLRLVWMVWMPLALIALTVCLLNWRHSGMVLAAAGIALNGVVVAANGGMPVCASNVPATITAVRLQLDLSWLHIPMSPSTILPFLADVIPVPGPAGFRGMASFGDLLLAIGVAHYLAASMHNQSVVAPTG